MSEEEIKKKREREGWAEGKRDELVIMGGNMSSRMLIDEPKSTSERTADVNVCVHFN